MNPIEIIKKEYDTYLRYGEYLIRCPALQYDEKKAEKEITPLRDWKAIENLFSLIYYTTEDYSTPTSTKIAKEIVTGPEISTAYDISILSKHNPLKDLTFKEEIR